METSRKRANDFQLREESKAKKVTSNVVMNLSALEMWSISESDVTVRVLFAAFPIMFCGNYDSESHLWDSFLCAVGTQGALCGKSRYVPVPILVVISTIFEFCIPDFTDHPYTQIHSIHCISISTSKRELNFALTCPQRLDSEGRSHVLSRQKSISSGTIFHTSLYIHIYNNSFLILHKTPRLVFSSCEVSGCCRRRPDEQTLRTPVLTSLRSLHLRLLINSPAAKSFLGNLIGPHLEEFSLLRHGIPNIEIVARRSACSLRSLSMIFTTFPPQYVEGFYNQCLHTMTLSMLSTTAFKITAPEKYYPRYMLQLVAKVLSTQST